MGAISIAFDTIIAGALALPWLLLVVHLFFPNGEQHVSDLPKRSTNRRRWRWCCSRRRI